MKNKSLSFILILTLILASFTACTTTRNFQEITCPIDYEPIEASAYNIMKYGNIVLDQPASSLFEKGYAYGDILTIKLGDQVLLAPLCSNYSDVDVGENVIITNEDAIIVAIDMGDFATTYGIAKKEKHADGTYLWILNEAKELSEVKLTLAMEEKEGYLSEYLLHNLVRTNNREDYTSDAVFANFRNVKEGNLGNNAFFRSSSPINPDIKRNLYADSFAKENGIGAVMNLADTPAELQTFVDDAENGSLYYKSLVTSGKVIALGLSVDFKAENFASGIADGLRFLSQNEGPYLVHCTEGKDRAGFTSALIEALMGVETEAIVADYMTTYSNYYGIEEGSDKFEAVKNSTILPMLSYLQGDAKTLQRGAEAYVLAGGLTSEELKTLKTKLSKNY